MFKFIHSADLHLDSPLLGLARYPGAPADQIRGATRQALTALVDLALEEAVAFVLIAGDLYDGDWKDYNTGLFFAHQMTRLRNGGIKVFMAAGNHDATSQMSRTLRLPENVFRFPTRNPGTEIMEELGVAVHGQGYNVAAVHADLVAGYPAALAHMFNIGLLHTSVTGRPGHQPYAPCTLDGLIGKGYHYWALGHVHQREVLCRDPWVVFPGNPQGRHIRETGPKGCALVTVDNGQVAMVEDVDLDVLRWQLCTINATGAETAAEVADRAALSLEQAVADGDSRFLAVRVHISGACRAHEELRIRPEHWVNEIRAVANDVGGGGSVWLEKVILETTGTASLKDLLAAGGALGSLLKGLRDSPLDEENLAGLAQQFESLFMKLPHELQSDPDSPGLDRPEYFRRAMEEVKEYLLARLLARGPGL
jgi:DNA repair protein SbcD/Mre11